MHFTEENLAKGNLGWVEHTSFLTSFSEFSIAIVFFALGFEDINHKVAKSK